MNIEELAFKDRRTLAQLNENDLLDIIEFLQFDRINQFAQAHNESVKIQKENKQLQERIEYLERSNNRREDTIIEQRQEISDLEDNWDELKEDLIKIRQLTFTKYNKNEWANCLSFNDDILPLIKKMQELQGSDSNE